MAYFRHMVLVKFKEGVVAEDMVKSSEELVKKIDVVKSFEWGEDIGTPGTLRQGYTHAFVMKFNNKDDYETFRTHPEHEKTSAKFQAAVEKLIQLNFPAILVTAAA
ncbi:hypothetical protein F0562_001900 [Nyssa sinensis]|uniref:Stress-response A/B barrel domain-containing protein n=1 Tax=Nyssa sinensis TaxID=561372 RepID=A0A5J5C5F9_9ASTE|nr:hypothetical protein F0562_001900 [Nyssa sinensis]